MILVKRSNFMTSVAKRAFEANKCIIRVEYYRRKEKSKVLEMSLKRKCFAIVNEMMVVQRE